MFTPLQSNNNSYAVTKLSTNIPAGLQPSQFSLDSVKLIRTPQTNQTHLFVRSQNNESRLYYSYHDWSDGTWSDFRPIGDDKHFLQYDFDVVLNTFLWVSSLQL